MSQYISMPPPGPYIPPNQGTPAQSYSSQQQPGFQHSPAPSPYQPAASKYGAPGHPNKAGSTFGQMMNQAVTTGKPMLNKLGKTISSKLGSKPAAGPPQHLHSYQNYQDHHGQQSQSQGYQQQPSQSFSPQPQQQQQQQPWGQQQQAPNAFTSPQQSPYQQSSYATPASGHSGQSNYFPQQTNQAPNSQPQTPQLPPNAATYNATQFEQSGLTMDHFTQGQQGQSGQGQTSPGQPQASFQQEQRVQGQYSGQQMGVVGGSQDSTQPQNLQSPHTSNVSPEIPAQLTQLQWGYAQPGAEQLSPSGPQQEPVNPMSLSQPFQPVTTAPNEHGQQQWNNMPPVSPQGQGQGQLPPHSISPPPPQQMSMSPQIPSNKPTQSSQASKPALQHAASQSVPTEFIAELPADMGNLSILESKPQKSDQSTQGAQYQAYNPSRPQSGSPSPGFTIPRRSVSSSNFPLADPWRFADPVTELPTREFFILADLLFDSLDRKFEPRNTGLLEAPKILGSWVKSEDAHRQLFSYKSYSALAKLWSLEGIPHIMVPCQSALSPIWNFQQHSHAQDVKVIAEPPTPMSTYATYMPALNRPAWYKLFFLEVMGNAPDIDDLIRALCADTYKPGILSHPDLNKRDRSEIPALQARASAIQAYSIGRVCEETKAAMAVDADVPFAHTHPSAPAAGSTPPSGNMYQSTWQ